MLVQALCKDYHLHRGPPRCALKVDLRKAFDSLNWSFIFAILRSMNFPVKFVHWIRICITSAMFSIKINGSLEGYFKGYSGLRQGDPISPYLFVIAMEILHSCLKKYTATEEFKFHWRTQEVKLNHLVFADDIFLFCNGDLQSVTALNSGLRAFSSISGLMPNQSKSCCFFANIPTDTQHRILQLTGFQLGHLPIKYLGLPLITSKLTATDCQPLLDRFCAKIQSWTSKFLSFGGRLTLIRVILNGIFGYWSMHLFLPKSILKKLNSIMFKFLWGGFYKPDGRCHHKVSWQDCCLPKSEGGLDIRNIFIWNNSAILFQIWRIVQPASASLWVRWFQSVLLKNKGFWTTKIPYKSSWGIRKIFNLRPQALQFIKYHVGLNSSFKFWLDPWLGNRPLIWDHNTQVVSNAESNILSSVGEYLSDQNWALPSSNFLAVLLIRQNAQNTRIHSADHLTWDGFKYNSVSYSTIWNAIRPRHATAPWFDIVWNTFSIPKCSFITWLALKDRLLTKDRMILFNMNASTNCLFCKDSETIQHLLSDCPFFDLMRRACPVKFSHHWNICQSGQIFAQSNDHKLLSIGSVYFTVAVYLLWRERNFRMHNLGQSHGSHSVIINMKTMAREKLFSCKKFRNWVHDDPTIICMLY